MDPEKIGKFIYTLRKEKNLSQYQLADLIPISRQAVSKWERGKTTPDSLTLIKLSEIFNVTIKLGWLFLWSKYGEQKLKRIKRSWLV